MMMMKQVGHALQPTFDYDEHLKALKLKFASLIRNLGPKNTKGSPRYEFEVEFMYTLNELEQGPIYLRGKLFERANEVTNKLIGFLKYNRQDETEPMAA